jgi:D-xylose transport system substrate-binding protein
MTSTTKMLAAGSMLLLALGSTACGNDKKSTTSSGSTPSSGSSTAAGGSGKTGTIALLLPETKTARYEAHDRPEFEAKMKQLCASCKILYSNANQDSAKQQQQADAALTQGAKVLVLDPVDGKAAQSIVAKAKQQKVAVVSYDRLVSGPADVYVSFQNEQVGKLQGAALLKGLASAGAKPTIVMINGDPADPNAAQFKKGAHSALDGKVTIGAEYDTPTWSNDKAQQEMQAAITKLGKSKIQGVYAANDGTGGGAIAAMKTAGFTKIPPVTGQDAELAGIQRIVSGDQYMTVYKATKIEAEAAAQAAYDLLQGKKPSAATASTNNGTANIPSILLTPVAVTKNNIKDTVIKDGFWKASEICTGAFAKACTSLGIS